MEWLKNSNCLRNEFLNFQWNTPNFSNFRHSLEFLLRFGSSQNEGAFQIKKDGKEINMRSLNGLLFWREKKF